MAKGRPTANATPFKKGDVVLFTKDIKKDSYEAAGYFSQPTKKVVIPANTPVIIVKANNSHVWVKFKNEEIWLRNIPARMIPATEAAIVLFGGK
jgi:hypothetical protein